MKKSLLALAVFGAFAGAAFAQSSVTLYGRVDLAVVRDDPKPAGVSARTGLDSGYYAGSRLGFRGSEDLGGGLSAIFQIENGFSPDTGTLGQGGRIFGRQAFAGLQGSFGTLVAGRIALPSSGTGTFDVFGAVDPFITGYGQASLGSTFNSAASLRADNSILYRSPSMGGAQVLAQYSFNFNGTEAAGGASKNNTILDLSVVYGAGPFYGVVTYDRVNNTTAGAPDQTHLQVGATYDLSVVKLHGGWGKQKKVFGNSSLGVTNGADATSYFAGVSVPLGGGSLLSTYQVQNGKAVGTVEADRAVISLGYAYPLSKRTQVHAVFSDSNGKKSLNNNPTYDSRQYAFGISHAF